MSQNPSHTSLEHYRSLLKSYDLKATPQRLAVHEAMIALGHASADMVADYISNGQNCRITVSSVYNILTQMSELGVYKHRMSSNNKMYFDVNPGKHIHLYDTYNNEFKDVLDHDLLEAIEEKLKGRRFKGMKIDGIDVQILCHPSRKRKQTL